MLNRTDLSILIQSIGPIAKKAILSGQILKPRCVLTEADPDIVVDYDFRIPLQNGTCVTANVFRSRAALERNEKVPVVMCAHPYNNALLPSLGNTPLGGAPQQYRLIPQEGMPEFSNLTSWESPDPNFWVPSGYAVVNLNLPGYASSEGNPSIFSRDQASAYAEAIDWVGSQDWCTGSVGLNGVSFLAISQYMVASGDSNWGVPKCLKAICPWEGLHDPYQDVFCEGGIKEKGFPVFWWHTEVKSVINTSVEDFIRIEGEIPPKLVDMHPFYDDYWQSKTANLNNIELPLLVCASFSDQNLHTRGSFRVFQQARSKHKWVYTHRRGKWDAYYSKEVQELTRDFFDCFLKEKTDNGFLAKKPVRLEVRSSRDQIHRLAEEQDWPLPETQYEKLFLRNDKSLGAMASEKTEFSYSASNGNVSFVYTFRQPMEITGYMKLRLWVESRGFGPGNRVPKDMALFVGVDKLDKEGNPVRFFGTVGKRDDLVSHGLLKVSRRKLDQQRSTNWEPVLANDMDEYLSPGDIVPVDVALNPSSTFFDSGESIRLVIAPREVVPARPFIKDSDANEGLHVVHAGEGYDSHLLVPMISPRQADSG